MRKIINNVKQEINKEKDTNEIILGTIIFSLVMACMVVILVK